MLFSALKTCISSVAMLQVVPHLSPRSITSDYLWTRQDGDVVTFSVFAACEALSSTFRPVSCPAISRTAPRNAALFVWNWSDETVTAPRVNRSNNTPLHHQ